MTKKFLKICILTIFFAACGPKNDTLTQMIIVTEDGPVVYQVETAATKEEMSKGLMNRKSLAADSGMIFQLQGQQDIAMWMKDTHIPLDMLFVNQQGSIIWIYENAEPLSTTLIRPQINEPLGAVIELNGGDVKKHNIKTGNSVRHKILQ